ncbi:hypothetical protein MPTK1_3g13200 [Marchantia polymorpha subsp. ruderalis]|uniref:Uncharacterized protein n=2 Tax=Marchantia polymorpha TaxID=3197 RepID=A0AAF6B0C1_MARPO|nr:hypothetical protein MARPO_0050s0112 [Marchantia polymorpha]BBN05455.1 hypothetical protein Mp_3g13200 [Marchantia polymorpha subsp. ruderalis]|eukprot:PTQ38668.1 hypothetical protein MARPO_0050s0112 [Marchantia polymorpha]
MGNCCEKIPILNKVGAFFSAVGGGVSKLFRKNKGPKKKRPPSKSILAMIKFPFGNYDSSDPQAAIAGAVAAANARPTSG